MLPQLRLTAVKTGNGGVACCPKSGSPLMVGSEDVVRVEKLKKTFELICEEYPAYKNFKVVELAEIPIALLREAGEFLTTAANKLVMLEECEKVMPSLNYARGIIEGVILQADGNTERKID